MAEIDIADLPSILDDTPGRNPKLRAVIVTRLGHVARTQLVSLAQKLLNTSARDYVAAITPMQTAETSTSFSAWVELRGALPNMVEHGRGPWDLRDTILTPSNKKVRRSKRGFLYAYIPFRHMGPDTSGRNAPAMGSQFTGAGLSDTSRAYRGEMEADDARRLGRAVMREAKKLEASRSRPGEEAPRMVRNAWGQMVPTGGVKYGERLGEGVGGAEILRPRHATDIFAGMIREEKTYEGATQSQYMTFRTISNNPETTRSDEAGGSPEKNWMHPGITARHLIPITMDYLDALIWGGAAEGLV